MAGPGRDCEDIEIRDRAREIVTMVYFVLECRLLSKAVLAIVHVQT
jgi:hypothetical protein